MCIHRLLGLRIYFKNLFQEIHFGIHANTRGGILASNLLVRSIGFATRRF